jgi:predicted metal-dependent phosphotriesterase family hydrolase
VPAALFSIGATKWGISQSSESRDELDQMATTSGTERAIQTVRGPIQADQLGVTLPHEHLYDQLWETPGRNDYAGQLEDDEVLYDEVLAFKNLGGQSIVECTVPGIGRSPEKLLRMSERTGIHIVMGCGWYREPYYPPGDLIDRRPVEDLAREIISEINQGVAGTGIRPGIIGEVGTDKSWVSAQEERVHRAAARAHLATGLALTTHSIGKPVGLTELAIFEDEGVDPRRIIIGHCDHPFCLFLDYHLELLKRGANVQFDTLGNKTPELDERAFQLLLNYLDRGYADQLLLSQDVCKIQHLRYLGGNGFCYVLDTFLPKLRKAGVPEDLITKMTVENPKRILTVKG